MSSSFVVRPKKKKIISLFSSLIGSFLLQGRTNEIAALFCIVKTIDEAHLHDFSVEFFFVLCFSAPNPELFLFIVAEFFLPNFIPPNSYPPSWKQRRNKKKLFTIHLKWLRLWLGILIAPKWTFKRLERWNIPSIHPFCFAYSIHSHSTCHHRQYRHNSSDDFHFVRGERRENMKFTFLCAFIT